MAVNPKHDFEAGAAADAPRISRRSLLAGAAAAAGLAATGFGRHAEASERRPSQMMHEMQDYAKDPNIRGVGAFINWQRGAPEPIKRHVSNQLRVFFGDRGIKFDHRDNPSNGTATDMTFYVGDYHRDLRIEDVFNQDGSVNKETVTREVVAHYYDTWGPAATVSVSPVSTRE